MVKLSRYMVHLILPVLIGVCGCSEDDLSLSSPDGSGGAGTEIPVPGEEASDPSDMCEGELQAGGESISFETIGQVGLSDSWELTCNRSVTEYCDMGETGSLGGVLRIPEKGWKDRMVLSPGHGYIIRRTLNGRSYYARLYVTEYMTDEAGGSYGVRIRYQSPLQLPIRLKEMEYRCSSDRSVGRIFMESPTYVRVDSAPEWCAVSCTDDCIYLDVQGNITSQVYEGEVVLSNCAGSSRIRIVQSASSSPSFAGGRGSRENPYLIRTPHHLDQVREWGCRSMKAYFSLENDIDVTSSLSESRLGWEPIGYDTQPFFGHFDGNGHTISGVWLSNPRGENQGFFGSIKNSEITGLRIELDKRGMVMYSGGGLCGQALNEVRIHQCSVRGDIVATSFYAGGILGSASLSKVLYASVTISECRVDGNVSGFQSSGICCNLNQSSPVYIENCYSTARLGLLLDEVLTLCGIGAESYCSFCYTVGEVADASCFYSIGFNNYNSCYFDLDVTGRKSDDLDYQNSVSRSPGARTTEEMMCQSTYAGWDFEHIWQIEEGQSYPTLRCFNR